MAALPPFPNFTKVWHNTSYPAISPQRPELSSKGRSVLITGGGTGIGAAVAHGFATAGSREIALLGRTQKTLSETADALKKEFPDIKVITQIADVASQKSVNAAFDAVIKLFGKIDVCISNAGYAQTPAPIADMDPEELTKALDTNVKGSLLVSQAFLRIAKDGAFLIHTSTG
jgi:NAD(P)-dependent dehydrogenase (short-subunit alcohol dehydrogenase family)